MTHYKFLQMYNENHELRIANYGLKYVMWTKCHPVPNILSGT